MNTKMNEDYNFFSELDHDQIHLFNITENLAEDLDYTMLLSINRYLFTMHLSEDKQFQETFLEKLEIFTPEKIVATLESREADFEITQEICTESIKLFKEFTQSIYVNAA